MDYRFSINFEGQLRPSDQDVSPRPSPLRGKRDGNVAASTCKLRATGSPPLSTDLWRLEALFERSSSGEPTQDSWLLLTGPMGGTVRCALQSGRPATFTDERGEVDAATIDLRFAVRESSGRLQGATGTVRVYGTVESGAAELTADLDLQAPESAWQPPSASTLTSAEAASGASPQGSQPLSQRQAEDAAEESVIRGVRHAGSRSGPSGS